MIRRRRYRMKQSEDRWLICVQILREPRAEDVENLGFRRVAAIADSTDELLQDDNNGDTLMRDLEIDMLNDDEIGNEANDNIDEDARIPPQWTPDRLLANTISEFVALSGAAGVDTATMRDRIIGPFWKRPLESHLGRLTDDWERMQPTHIRHLALIRDTATSEERKFIHYVYRTYKNFQLAVDAKVALWDVVLKSGAKPSRNERNPSSPIDRWGFQKLDSEDFIGTKPVSHARSANVHHMFGPRWDKTLSGEIGYDKPPMPTLTTDGRFGPKRHSTDRRVRKPSRLMLTSEARIMLGLKPGGRLSKMAEDQILAHRQKTGDPTSLPDKIIGNKALLPGQAPLLTAEERIAQGLPPRGRLGRVKENELREQRGLPKLVSKAKKKTVREPITLNREQRRSLGLLVHGRLHDHLFVALRKERDEGIPLEESPAVEAYRVFLKENAAKKAEKEAAKAAKTIAQIASLQNKQAGRGSKTPARNLPLPGINGAGVNLSKIPSTAEKRKATIADAAPPSPKRRRTEVDAQQGDATSMSPLLAAPLGDATLTTVNSDGPANFSRENTATIGVTKPEGTPLKTRPSKILGPRLGIVKLGPDDEEIPARSSPGVYVYPSAKRNLGKGRPRKAFVVIFKVHRLHEMEWFKPDSSDTDSMTQIAATEPHASRAEIASKAPEMKSASDTQDVSQVAATESPHLCSMDSIGNNAIVAATRSCDSADFTTASQPTQQSVVDVEPRADTESTPREVFHPTMQPAAGPQQQPQSLLTPDERYPGPVNFERQIQSLIASPQQQVISTPIPDLAIEQTTHDDQSPEFHAMPSRIGGWNPINVPEQAGQSTYQSPYAPFTGTLTSGVASRAPTTTYDTLLSRGLVSAVTEVQDPEAVKVATTKSAGPGITGSAIKMRRDIIFEIIELCGGVYPLHGEIVRPFIAMWEQRHGHTSLQTPASSTIMTYLKTLIANPQSKLKRLAFLIKAKNAAGAKERVMVAKAHIAANDPRVLQLAHKMANFALDKSHQYFPKEIRHLFDYKSTFSRTPIAPKDHTVSLDQLPSSGLDWQIKEEKARRRKELVAQKKRERDAARSQNREVEQVVRKRHTQATELTQSEDIPRTRRTRLASLNDKSKRYRLPPTTQVSSLDQVHEEHADVCSREPSLAPSDPSEGVPLMSLRPWVGDIEDRGANDEDAPLSDVEAEEEQDDTVSDTSNEIVQQHLLFRPEVVSFTHPTINFHLPTGTFSTTFNLNTPLGGLPSLVNTAVNAKAVAKKGNKRVRIAEPNGQPAKKRARGQSATKKQRLDDEFVHNPVEDSDDTSSEEEVEVVQSKPKQKRARAFRKRQLGKKLPLPTLLERLTGLTGDPNDPIYNDPKAGLRPYRARLTEERNKTRVHKPRKDKEYSENLDTVNRFKKFCFTLALALSMSGDDGVVDWSIVEKAYARDKFFCLPRAQNLWAWMQLHMNAQITGLINTFQSQFLEAYESGRIPVIDDPETYDWAGLVRWSTRACVYSELPLPLLCEALRQFVVDESDYAALDRGSWYGTKISDTARTQLQLQYSYVAPLHRSRTSEWSADDKVLKARSWTRANIATPQARYDANKAHDKLTVLGEEILVRVVEDYVQEEHLKMRKLKRQLPGRNYTFTNKFAKKYKRPFELGDFIDAANFKKALDEAFSDEDQEKRTYNIARCEEDSSVMTIMSLVADGKVILVPQLPSVNNKFGAPLPRFSKWGFCEGGYSHRAIDRDRFFWDVHAVPTSNYQFGNPLQPLPAPVPAVNGVPAGWTSLPEPPLPGKHDNNALLPIWSSLDGQSVTWPWWYRILNLVLQPLYLQPGATATDVYFHCPSHTTEMFEVELVLGWLKSVGAVTQGTGGGYHVTASFWASFGDKLRDTEDDWFGEHVKRTNKAKREQRWRDKYNLRYSTLQARAEGDVSEVPGQTSGDALSEQIVQNSKNQYGILQQSLLDSALLAGSVQQQQAEQTPARTDTASVTPESSMSLTLTNDANVHTGTPYGDVDMTDADADADADGDDVDAEGVIDDEFY
jgi:hypothetical protein